ncbi:MAG: phosphatase domain-containing protein [Oligoflexus sp.]
MSPFQTLSRRNPFRRYDFRRLIDTRHLLPYDQTETHIICDIDKTYLETNSEGAIQMIRIAFEEARDKISVAGASPFLIAARWGNPYVPCQTPSEFHPRSLHFVSASPPQLRRTLEDKLIQDGLDWNSDSFKNQAYNIRKGRLGLLRHHVAYKTASMLHIMQQATENSQFYLIGDNAEYDAYIYLGISLFLQGTIDCHAYEKYLCAGGVQTQTAADLRSLMEHKPKARVAGILIRKAPGFHLPLHPPLTDPIVMFENYYEALLVLVKWGLVEAGALPRLSREFHNHHGFSRERLISCLQTAKSSMFRQDFVVQKEINATISMLDKAGELGRIPDSRCILPASSLSEWQLSQEQMIEHATAWAEKLIQCQSYPVTK